MASSAESAHANDSRSAASRYLAPVGQTAPSVILTNARIGTGNPARPWTTALALEGDTLAAIASAAEILKLAGPATRVLDAGGRTVTLPPGVVVGSRVHLITDDGDVRVAPAMEEA